MEPNIRKFVVEVASMREWQREERKTKLEHSAKQARKAEKTVDRLLKPLMKAAINS